MNSSRLAGRDMKSERHLITGVCNCNATSCDYATCDNTTGVAQMWNWGFEEIVPLESLSNKTICPSVWIKDLTAGGTSTMQLPCLPMPVTMLPKAALGSSNSAINAFSSSATRIRNEETGLTRNNLHIVFTVAPEDPTHYLVGGGMYSYDGGASWDSIGTETYYEQHIDPNHDRTVWGQAWQFDYEATTAGIPSTAREVCFRVWLTDTNTGKTAWLNATSAMEMHCMPVCTQLIQFHWPKGYCPGTPTIKTRGLPLSRGGGPVAPRAH